MEFKKISETEILNEVPEGASVLGIVDGAVKQMPTDGMGGSGKTLIIKYRYFEDGLSPDSGAPMSARSSGESEYTANMTYDELLDAFTNCELQGCVVYLYDDYSVMLTSSIMYDSGDFVIYANNSVDFYAKLIFTQYEIYRMYDEK